MYLYSVYINFQNRRIIYFVDFFLIRNFAIKTGFEINGERN